MATTNARTISDNSAFAGRSTTRWPVYASKEALLIDLLDSVAAGPNKINDVMQRLGNTDTSGWTDKGSRIR